MRRSNAYAIVSALREHGFQRVADDHICAMTPAELRERLRFHLETHDVLVLSGGVSMGRFDLVPEVLQELGVRAVFHKVAQRPGKPLWFGVAPSGAAVFGLPGQPGLDAGVPRPLRAAGAAQRASGRAHRPPERMALGAPVTVTPPLTHFCPCASSRTTGAATGRCRCRPTARAISRRWPAPMALSNFRPGPNTYPKGFVTRLYRWCRLRVPHGPRHPTLRSIASAPRVRILERHVPVKSSSR